MAKKGYKASHIPDFAGAMQLLRVTALKTATGAVRRFVETERRGFQEAIRHQDFRSFHQNPLSARWLAKKHAAGADLRVMIATGTYVSTIRTFMRRASGGGYRFRIGFAPNQHARNLDRTVSPLLLSDLAAIHENGTGKVPARPHWQPYLRGMMVRARLFREELAERIAGAVQAKIEKGK